jgi:hypothetical protein
MRGGGRPCLCGAAISGIRPASSARALRLFAHGARASAFSLHVTSMHLVPHNHNHYLHKPNLHFTTIHPLVPRQVRAAAGSPPQPKQSDIALPLRLATFAAQGIGGARHSHRTAHSCTPMALALAAAKARAVQSADINVFIGVINACIDRRRGSRVLRC